MTPTQLIAATGCTVANAERYAGPLAKAMELAGIDTPLRTVHFISQCAHETACFVYLTELADGTAYEGSVKLGNIHPGDGPRFKGRGLIQLTGRNNYRDFGAWLKAKFGMDVDLLEHPEIVATNPLIACLAAAWYWISHKLNAIADDDGGHVVQVKVVDKAGERMVSVNYALRLITKSINGGTNGIEDRQRRFTAAKLELGIP